MSPPLPIPRALLTSLITTLFSHQISQDHPSNNPLQNAPLEIRSLLTTLHIIFPHLLLPALDLLDRQMLTRISQLHPNSGALGGDSEINTFYLVQSSQSTGRRTHKNYTIRLKAWNCTCASFTFSAFPPEISSATMPLPQQVNYTDLMGDAMEEQAAGKWEFGGLSTDGKDGGSVPACKHLLACVLADRWPALKGMVNERCVEREQMAGLGAGF